MIHIWFIVCSHLSTSMTLRALLEYGGQTAKYANDNLDHAQRQCIWLSRPWSIVISVLIGLSQCLLSIIFDTVDIAGWCHGYEFAPRQTAGRLHVTKLLCWTVFQAFLFVITKPRQLTAISQYIQWTPIWHQIEARRTRRGALTNQVNNGHASLRHSPLCTVSVHQTITVCA